MARSLRRGLVTLALTAGLGVAASGTASAQTLSVTDARADLLSYAAESDTGSPAPEVADGDVLRMVVSHTQRRVSVRLRFAELRKVGDMRADSIRVVTNEGVRRDVFVFAYPQRWGGEAGMARPNGRDVPCDGLTHRIDYGRNTVTVSFPRTCVSSPRWVQVGAGSFWGRGEAFYVDDAQRAGKVDDTRLRLSGRVRRG